MRLLYSTVDLLGPGLWRLRAAIPLGAKDLSWDRRLPDYILYTKYYYYTIYYILYIIWATGGLEPPKGPYHYEGVPQVPVL